MTRRLLALIAAVVVLSTPVAVFAAPSGPQPRAWVLFDAETGVVLDAHNERETMSPASLTKLLTALVVVDRLAPGTEVPVSATAAKRPPMKMGLRQGEVWNRDILLNVMMLSSANDAAVALAEASAGSLGEFVKMRAEAATELGLADGAIFNDPSGLDNADSFSGGDITSARDMAIVARAALANPELRRIASQPTYTYTGLTGNEWTVKNHNRFLTAYPGAIGLKTGYTKKAQHTFVGAAERDGRQLVAVVLGAASPYPKATELLDAGFGGEFGSGTSDEIPAASLDTHSAEAVQAALLSSGFSWTDAALAIVVTLAALYAWLRYRRMLPSRSNQHSRG